MLVGTFNEEKALVGAFSVIVKSENRWIVCSTSPAPGHLRTSTRRYLHWTRLQGRAEALRPVFISPIPVEKKSDVRYFWCFLSWSIICRTWIKRQNRRIKVLLKENTTHPTLTVILHWYWCNVTKAVLMTGTKGMLTKWSLDTGGWLELVLVHWQLYNHLTKVAPVWNISTSITAQQPPPTSTFSLETILILGTEYFVCLWWKMEFYF